jgi:hypothetical protein
MTSSMKKTFIFSAITLIPIIAAAFPQPEKIPQPQERYESAVTSINNVYNELEKARREAREQRDTIRYVCVEDKQRAVAATLKQIEGRKQLISASLQINDMETATHEAIIAEEIFKRVSGFADEAKLCAGSKISKSDDSETVTVTFDDSITPVDATPPIPSLVIEPPACASCFR